ncbi:ABC transporter permease [Fulvivirgaceae bacterium BMA12]|uniref:ABC transporter permease n=1 Tax=Agaribacillus aureus TaxID=3051825 RepID=A0ABT8L537_9BACT|nr:ABC transporter permease [Fulvivirgaceae bacterium BMA12]
MKQRKNRPPILANWLASKFINEALLEELFGDLKEIYEDRIATKGKFYAKCMYWVDTFHLLIGFGSPQLFKNKPAIMYEHYLNIASRNLMKNKWYSLVNIGGLTVGMGVCLLIFQYTYFELSYDKFHDNFQNTYRIITDKTQNDVDDVFASTTYGIGPTGKETIHEIKEYVRMTPQFGGTIVTNPDKNESFSERNIFYVDTTFLQVFNFPLKLGSKESVFDGMYNIVITQKMAEKYFGAENPMGKPLNLSSKGEGLAVGNYIVSGVLEDLPINSHLQFDFLLSMENYMKLGWWGQIRERDNGWKKSRFVTYITLEESANLDLVHKKLNHLTALYRSEITARENIVEKVRLQPIADVHLKPESYMHSGYVTNYGNIKNVEFFLIIAFFILFIAWVNYINLSTARSMHRAKEVGIRKSIGAFRKQLISQFMMESILVNLTAALLAIGLAFSSLPILSGIIGKELELNILQIPMFWGWFSMVIIFGSLLSGLYPAFVLSSFKPISMLGANKTSRAGNTNLRRGLIVFQFLTSLLLISGTYLVHKQITFMKRQDLGLDIEKVMVFNGPERFLDRSTLEAFTTEVARHHSISGVAASGSLPGDGWSKWNLHKPGETITEGQFATPLGVSLNFPEVYDLEFLAGSSFVQSMSNEDYVVIINEEAVRTFGFGSPENAIRKTLIKPGKETEEYKIIGVVKNFHWLSLREPYGPCLFVLSVEGAGFSYFSFKTNLSDIQESLTHIEKTYKSFFPVDVFDYFFLEDEFNRQYQADLQFGNLFLAFAALAIFIACIGLFALVSFSATSRIKEIGIRKVLGASVNNLMMLLSSEYLMLISIAVVLAIPAILYWGKAWLENYAFRIDIEFDLFIIPALVLVLASIITVSYRTYATAKANPVDSLRKE